ncbi:hypothetical protein NPIL_59121, partial [Nephila pilipes]
PEEITIISWPTAVPFNCANAIDCSPSVSAATPAPRRKRSAGRIP